MTGVGERVAVTGTGETSRFGVGDGGVGVGPSSPTASSSFTSCPSSLELSSSPPVVWSSSGAGVGLPPLSEGMSAERKRGKENKSCERQAVIGMM